MSLIFNTLSRSSIAFLPRSKHILILWLQSPSAVKLEPKKIKYITASTFLPSVCHEVMRPGAMIFVFQMLSFKAAFSLSSFTLIKRVKHFKAAFSLSSFTPIFSSSLLLAIRVLFHCISGVVAIYTSNVDSSL